MNDAATGCCDLCTCASLASIPATAPRYRAQFLGKLGLDDPDECSNVFTVRQEHGAEFYGVIDGSLVILPWEGMETDLGSYPWFSFSAQRLKNSYKKSFVCHDTVYYMRYVIASKSGTVGAVEAKYLQAAAHIHDEDDRLHILAPAFDLLPVSYRGIVDDWLDWMIYAQSKGDAKYDRAITRAGLLLGSWGPWYFGKYGKRLDYIQQHALKFPIRVLEPQSRSQQRPG